MKERAPSLGAILAAAGGIPTNFSIRGIPFPAELGLEGYLTVRVPFMPAASWPGTEQKNV